MNAITHEVITVTNDTYINAESVCQLLHKLTALGLTIPITLVLDNARYQKCKLVQEARGLSGHRVALFAILFPQPQSHRTALEICQEEMFVLQILC